MRKGGAVGRGGSRRDFVKQFGAAAAALALPRCAPAGRPNILFIMSNDHPYNALSCYGSKINQTPNLDRLAQDRTRFDRAYVTTSLGAPSRASILTGKGKSYQVVPAR